MTKNPFGLVDLQGRPLGNHAVMIDPVTGKVWDPAADGRLTHRAKKEEKDRRPRPWRRADALVNRRRTGGRLTRKARKARTRVTRQAYRYGLLKR